MGDSSDSSWASFGLNVSVGVRGKGEAAGQVDWVERGLAAYFCGCLCGVYECGATFCICYECVCVGGMTFYNDAAEGSMVAHEGACWMCVP